jgi:hypothetical protein
MHGLSFEIMHGLTFNMHGLTFDLHGQSFDLHGQSFDMHGLSINMNAKANSTYFLATGDGQRNTNNMLHEYID